MKALILSGIKWNDTQQRHHKIANWLIDMGYDLSFVEDIPSSKVTVKKVLERLKRQKVEQIEINNRPFRGQLISSHFLPPNIFLNIINKTRAKKIIAKTGRDFDLVVTYLPIASCNSLIQKLNYKTLVYDCVRDFVNWGGYRKCTKKNEEKLIAAADLVLCDSYYLAERKQGIQILPSLSNEQLKVFSSKKAPKSIKKLVYFGQIDTHIDCELLKALSQDYEINLIGSANIALNFDYKNRGYFSDKVKLAKEIIKYDAIIIPYRGNMDGVIPAKLMESLASNMPVFIKDFYDSRKLSDYCYVYRDLADLQTQLTNYRAGQKKSAKKLIKANTEEEQFKRFKKLIEETSKKQKSKGVKVNA